MPQKNNENRKIFLIDDLIKKEVEQQLSQNRDKQLENLEKTLNKNQHDTLSKLELYVQAQNNVERKTLLRWFLGTIPTFVLVLSAIAGLIFVYQNKNFEDEKKDLEKFKEEIKNELLGIAKKEVKLRLLTRNGDKLVDLEGQTIDVSHVRVFDKNPQNTLELNQTIYEYSVPYFIANDGEGFLDYKTSFIIYYANQKKYPSLNNCIDYRLDYNNCDLENIGENSFMTKINKGREINERVTTRTPDKPQEDTTEKVRITIIYGSSDKEEISAEFYIRFKKNIPFVNVYK